MWLPFKYFVPIGSPNLFFVKDEEEHIIYTPVVGYMGIGFVKIEFFFSKSYSSVIKISTAISSGESLPAN